MSSAYPPPTRSYNARLAFAAGWLLFWLLMIVVAVQDYLRDGGTQLWQPLLWEGSSALIGTVLLATQIVQARRARPMLDRPPRWFLLQLRWLPLQCVGFVAAVYALRHGVYRLMGQQYTHEGWGALLVYESMKMTVFLGLFAVVLFGLQSYQALAEQRALAARADALARQAQLDRLTQQIQPHFLFNALNTISSLIASDPVRADDLLNRLADVLRASLELAAQPQVTLARELAVLRAYSQLMSERFDDRVALSWQIAADALACQVPAMSLQLLLENVFKHTVERRSQTTTITISAARDGGVLVVTIADDSGSLQRNDGGTGLRNLRERLAALHGEAASLTLTQDAPAGVTARMRVPCTS